MDHITRHRALDEVCLAVLACNGLATMGDTVGMELNHGDKLPLRRLALDMAYRFAPRTSTKDAGNMRTVLIFHEYWFYLATGMTALVGLWGITLAAMKRRPPRGFVWARSTAITVMLVQVASGVFLFVNDVQPADLFHVFYGVVMVVIFTLAYVYRAAMARKPALTYGVLLTFIAAMGIRAWTTVL